MPACCDHQPRFTGEDPRFKRVLLAIIAINVVMFLVELGAGLIGQSMALQADSLDFLADSATYAITLLVIGKPVRIRSLAALAKGLSLGALGLWVAGASLYRVFVLHQPDAVVMGGIGLLAFAANVACALLLLKWRNGDANVRSVWICSRNDALGNLAVVLAASGVFLSGTPWPDLLVAGAMSALFLSGAWRIVRAAAGEMSAAQRVGAD